MSSDYYQPQQFWDSINSIIGFSMSIIVMGFVVGMVKPITKRDKPVTPGQIRYITILCQKLGIKEPLEEKVKTDGEAGRLIRELEGKVRGLSGHHSSGGSEMEIERRYGFVVKVGDVKVKNPNFPDWELCCIEYPPGEKVKYMSALTWAKAGVKTVKVTDSRIYFEQSV